MTLQIKNGSSSLLAVSGALANHADCCCDTNCCFDNLSTIEVFGLTGVWSGFNGFYSLSAHPTWCQSNDGLSIPICSSPNTYFISEIAVGTTLTSAFTSFSISLVLTYCNASTIRIRQFYQTTSLCSAISSTRTLTTSSPSAPFPSTVTVRNIS